MIPKISYRYVEDEHSAALALGDLASYDEIGLDIETSDYQFKHLERISVVSLAVFADGAILAWIIDCFKVDFRIFKDLLADDTTLFAIHNGRDFDMPKIRQHYGLEIRNCFDTLIAERSKRGRGGNKLDEVASRHLGWVLDKSHQTSDWGVRPIPSDMLAYAAKDAAAHLLIYLEQKRLGYEGEFTKQRDYTETQGDLLPGMSEAMDLPAKKFWLEQFIQSGAARRFNKEWCSNGIASIHILPGDTEPYAAHLNTWLEIVLRQKPRGSGLLEKDGVYEGCAGTLDWSLSDKLCLQALDDLIRLVKDGVQPNPKALEEARARAYRERKDCQAGYDQYVFEQALKFHATGHFPHKPKLTVEELNRLSWTE